MRREEFISSKWKATADAQARVLVNRFLLSQVGSQFCAGDPELDVLHEEWCVPILLVTPGFVAGQVGYATIDLNTGEVRDHTNTEQLYLATAILRRRHQGAIEDAFLGAREG